MARAALIAHEYAVAADPAKVAYWWPDAEELAIIYRAQTRTGSAAVAGNGAVSATGVRVASRGATVAGNGAISATGSAVHATSAPHTSGADTWQLPPVVIERQPVPIRLTGTSRARILVHVKTASNGRHANDARASFGLRANNCVRIVGSYDTRNRFVTRARKHGSGTHTDASRAAGAVRDFVIRTARQ